MSGKIIIYQTLPRISGNRVSKPVPGNSYDINGTGKFSDFTDSNLSEIKSLGCTHIWFTGILEHATQSQCLSSNCVPDPPEIVKGIAGSPYSVKDYYDVAHYLADNHERRVEEFEELVIRCHNAGLKVIIDFVPNHVSRVYKSDKNPGLVPDIGENDFYYLPGKYFKSPVNNIKHIYEEYPARATGNNCFTENPTLQDWYETVKLNYGVDYFNHGTKYFDPVPPLWDKMVDIILYWSGKGVDGFRCDMAEMVPSEFWKYLTDKVKTKFPGLVFIAEIYNPDSYRTYLNSGFDLLYDKVGLYDTLIEIIKGESTPDSITKCWQSLGDIQDCMLNFIENHDEQRVASDFVAKSPERGLPATAVSALLNKSSFLLYFGQEIGERGMNCEGFSSLDGRTSIFDFWSLESFNNYRKGIYDYALYNKYKFLLNVSLNEQAIKYGETYDLQYANISNDNYNNSKLFSFARYYNNDIIFIIVNFSVHTENLALNIPEHFFTHWKIQKKANQKFIDLWSGEEFLADLSPTDKLILKVEQNFVKIFKLSLQ
ncbi:alpha-amylase family glycosyl hydrolase [Bacteroidales bacterium MB20-C3-3]|nr:alpha-amylase family glycosyl hydrolase [Bacteroidales bacterium MB20-C3-3]